MNKGERDELLIKLKLIEMRDAQIIPAFLGVPISQLGFGNVTYASLPPNTNLSLIRNNDPAINLLCCTVGIQKASTTCKSDVYINNFGYSLKSLSAAPPALVNHTTRPGFESACRYSGANIAMLDQIIYDYWNKRTAGIIKEDVHNYIGTTINPNSPFVNHQAYMKPILEYFLFIGSANCISPYRADFILDYVDPLNPTTWHIYDPTTAVNLLWPKLIFSVRATKGMPTNYNPNTYNGQNAASIKTWVSFSSNKYRGALHIRAK